MFHNKIKPFLSSSEAAPISGEIGKGVITVCLAKEITLSNGHSLACAIFSTGSSILRRLVTIRSSFFCGASYISFLKICPNASLILPNAFISSKIFSLLS